jgi:RES domain-containing protein
LLEYFVHLDKDDPPSDLVLAVAEIPNDLSRVQVELKDLPSNWRAPAAPPELAQIGDEFVSRQEHCLLLVPSVLSSNEHNSLINPAHPEFKRVAILENSRWLTIRACSGHRVADSGIDAGSEHSRLRIPFFVLNCA